MYKKVLPALTIATTVAVVGIQGPAQAVLGCTPGAICYYDSGYTSEYPMIDHDGADSNPNECHNVPVQLRNRISYIRNWSSYQWYVYTGGGCGGTSGLIYANSSGVMTGVYNNSIDSYRRIG